MVDTGVLSRLGGGARDRARTLLTVLAASYVLVTAGPLPAVRAWSAALGMLVIGFAVAYGSVGGPRLVDVLIGAAVGALAGLCAWPRGEGSELRRSIAGLLADSALALRETVAPVSGTTDLGVWLSGLLDDLAAVSPPDPEPAATHRTA